MSVVNQTIEAGGALPPAMVRVWDPFVRVFHWSLVGLFVLAYATGDEFERVHIAGGYAIAVLLALRVVWGFLGPTHARFADFVRSPAEVFAYLQDVVHNKPRRYLGHNPAGGAMIVVMILMLAATSVTGYMMTTDAYWGAKWVEEFHEGLANVTVGVVLLHVIGVLAASFQHRENLVKAMITGRKWLTPTPHAIAVYASQPPSPVIT
jgi:cytochrome b